MKKWPSFRQFEYLIALQEHQNFHRAAKACHVSQSTLSSGIQALEEILGVQLIERDQKSFIMTALGTQMIERSKQILSLAQDMLESGQVGSGSLYGEVRLGCIPTIAPFLLGDFIKRCSADLSTLKLFLREDTSDNLLRMLEIGELDLLIVALPIDTRMFHTKTVGYDPFRLVIHPDDAPRYENRKLSDALPEKSLFLLESEHCLSKQALSACNMHDQSKINPFTATSLHTLVHMVSSGLGVTFLPQMAIDAGILNQTPLLALEPHEQNAYREIGIVWRPSSSRIQTFYKLSEVLATLLPKN